MTGWSGQLTWKLSPPAPADGLITSAAGGSRPARSSGCSREVKAPSSILEIVSMSSIIVFSRRALRSTPSSILACAGRIGPASWSASSST